MLSLRPPIRRRKVAEHQDSSVKAEPESLLLRAAPRRVIRFKRKLLMGSAGIAAVALFVVMGAALQSPSAKSKAEGQELYNIDHKTTADALTALPADYAQAKKPVPQLGEPLPGDLGRTMVAHERGNATAGGDYGANEEANQARAERLRRLQQARQAKEASVFFQLGQGKA